MIANRNQRAARAGVSSQEGITGRSGEPPKEVNAGGFRPLAKSADPAYVKFTTYVRKSTHLGVKTRLVSKEKELSDLVEELLSKWLKENDSFNA